MRVSRPSPSLTPCHSCATVQPLASRRQLSYRSPGRGARTTDTEGTRGGAPMVEPNPRLEADCPLEVLAARTLFRTAAIRHRGAASIVRLDSGRLLLAFRLGRGPGRQNDGAIMLTYSDNDGADWDEPFPVYAYPGWDSLPMGGLVRFSDERLHLILGRVKVDDALGGDEPFSDWYIAAIESRDGGQSWSEP